MALQVVLHLHNEDPFVADIDSLPEPTHTYVRVTNPRKRDGKPIPTLTNGATAFLYPWTRITFIEVMDDGQSHDTSDTLMSFFREGKGRR